MKKTKPSIFLLSSLAAAAALCAGAADVATASSPSPSGATSAPLPNLRGFGRAKVERAEEGGVSVLRFACETAENAETVAGKFLMDLSAQDGVSFRDGIHETKGGAAFAVLRDGTRTEIFAAAGRGELEEYFSHKEHKGRREGDGRKDRERDNGFADSASFAAKDKLVETAECPEYMKAFRWGVYGIGGLESFHGWMNGAKKRAGIDPKADKAPLDPREDFEFLRQMGNMHFDNWLEIESFDNSDGIVASGVYSRTKLAEDIGIPMGWRFYLPAGSTRGYDWYTRRFAARLDKPAEWMQGSWLRYNLHQPHQSWYDEEAWDYNAALAKKAMERVKTGRERTWMHPSGEVNHSPWYDWHADYSETAAKSWRAYLSERMTLAEAAAAYNRPGRPFASWDEVPVPEFATFAGLGGMVLDLEGTWQTSTNGVDWTEIHMPGSWDFLGLYGGANAAMKQQRTAERRFKRTFEWGGARSGATAAGGDALPTRIYLYFEPMMDQGGKEPRHEVSLNGAKPVTVGQWCALDVTDALKEGENEIDILLRGVWWNGRIFLSSEKPEMYPNMPEARCRLWTLWHGWRRDTKIARMEAVCDAMRQADPNAPIEFMAPISLGQRVTDRLLRDWGGFAQFTGEGIWFFPWYKRYGKLYGYQGTSELAGPYDNVGSARRCALRVFLAGLDMHKPVFMAQTYSRNPPVREWWLAHKDLFARMGRYDIDLAQPQVLIYRRTELTYGAFPAPFPAVDDTVKGPRSPWNHDIGRGELQSIGQSFLYLDDDGIEDGKMDGFRVMFDCGNEIVPEDEVARIKAWVERGGVFVAYPFTGRSTPIKADAWPMAALTGSKIKAGEKVVTPGNVPKVSFPEGSKFFPSFAGRTIHGAKRRMYQLDFALETVADDAEPILFWEDGRVAATVRRVGKGMVVHLGSMFWRGSEDVKGMWHPQDEVERAFLRDLLAAAGHPAALVETDDRLVLAQPYRSHDGLDLVAVLCNFNEEPEGDDPSAEAQRRRETVVTLRTGRKPRRIVGYAGVDLFGHKERKESKDFVDSASFVAKDIPFDWDEAAGVATMKVSLPPQEVAVIDAECYAPGDALGYWWRNSAEQWHELKKPVRDFSKYEKGEWKDPTQDLKTGWEVFSLPNGVEESLPAAKPLAGVPLDALQFWGWPEGKGAVCRKVFDLDEPSWAAGSAGFQPADGAVPAQTRLVVGAWVGPNYLSAATIRLNGETLAKNTRASYLEFDVSAKLKAAGNVLEVEFADAGPNDGKFTGMNGSIYLCHRDAPVASVDVLKGERGAKVLRGADGKDSFTVEIPAEWKGKYRVRLYMEGAKNVPLGVRVRDRFMRKHHHNFGNVTDIDVTALLDFGAENRVEIGANSPGEGKDKTSLAPVTSLRLDLYPENR